MNPMDMMGMFNDLQKEGLNVSDLMGLLTGKKIPIEKKKAIWVPFLKKIEGMHLEVLGFLEKKHQDPVFLTIQKENFDHGGEVGVLPAIFVQICTQDALGSTLVHEKIALSNLASYILDIMEEEKHLTLQEYKQGMLQEAAKKGFATVGQFQKALSKDKTEESKQKAGIIKNLINQNIVSPETPVPAFSTPTQPSTKA